MPVQRRPFNVEQEPPRSYSKRLGASKLYSNDFDSLLAFLRDRAAKVSARGGETAWLESGDDLRELRISERANLVVTTEDPALTVSLGRGSVLTKELESDEAKTLVDDVAALFDAWQSVSARVAWGVWLGFPAAYLGLVGIVGLVVSLVRGEVVKFDSGVFVPLLLSSLIIPFLTLFAARVIVRKRTRHDSAETRMRVLGSVGLAVLGGIAGALATYFFALRDK